MRAVGFLSCIGGVDSAGGPVAPDEAVRRGWINPGEIPAGFDLAPGAVPLGSNLWVAGGRQYAVYALAFRAPATNYTLQKFSVGTGTTPPDAADVAMQNPVAFSGGAYSKQVDSIQFPAPFTMNVIFTLGAADCNGYLLTEFGLLAGDGTLMARVVRPGLNKVAAFAPTLSWQLRF